MHVNGVKNRLIIPTFLILLWIYIIACFLFKEINEILNMDRFLKIVISDVNKGIHWQWKTMIKNSIGKKNEIISWENITSAATCHTALDLMSTTSC